MRQRNVTRRNSCTNHNIEGAWSSPTFAPLFRYHSLNKGSFYQTEYNDENRGSVSGCVSMVQISPSL